MFIPEKYKTFGEMLVGIIETQVNVYSREIQDLLKCL